MSSRLNLVQNWPELARQVKWSVKALATKCGVSVRTLRRHFLKQMGQSTKAWLAAERQRQAVELLHNGSSVKETATSMGYNQPANFTRKYKNHWGVCPSMQTPVVNPAQTANVRK
jgi:transcriptional regulator GlxA family with amidase domain